MQHLTNLQQIHAGAFLWMDRFTIRNLELIYTPSENGVSLLQSMDATITPMGARMLKRWLMFPLVDLGLIRQRHQMVAALMQDTENTADIRQHLKAIGDIERLVAKVPLKKISPREVVQLARSLRHTDAIKAMSSGLGEESLRQLLENLKATQDIQDTIQQYLKEEPSVSIQKGNVIQDGLNEDLDTLRQIAYNGKEYLNQIQEKESAATGIPSLKIAFNNVFGYYLEVTNTHKDKVPEHWIRKQTLANAERYITPELKSYEEKILGAEEKIYALEVQLYDELLDKLQLGLRTMQLNAQIVAQLDCLQSLAHIAVQHNYIQPEMWRSGDTGHQRRPSPGDRAAFATR